MEKRGKSKVLVSSGERPGMLLSILQCTRVAPSTKKDLVQDAKKHQGWEALPQRKVLLFAISAGCFREGDDTPLQYCCLENPMDGGAWWAAVHGVAKSQTQLSNFTFTFHFFFSSFLSFLVSQIWVPSTRKPTPHSIKLNKVTSPRPPCANPNTHCHSLMSLDKQKGHLVLTFGNPEN